MAFDIKKEIKDMKRELSLKLSKFAVGEDVIKKYIEFSSPEIADKAKKLWKRYIEKFHKSSNIKDKEQALIKMYSNYKALKVIGNVCKDIIEETNFGKKKLNPNEIKEFMGALDVAELAKEQKKFELRAKHKKFSIKDGEAKIAEILATYKSMSVDEQGNSRSYFANTPFGEIKIDCRIDTGGETRMIVTIKDGEELPYKDIATNLDKAISKFDDNQSKLNLVNCIKQYITQKIILHSSSNIYRILNNLEIQKCEEINKLSEEEKDYGAVLCGCLLFAESSQIRNPTRGKLEKKAIKKVEKLIKQKCTNPFGVVFAGQSVNNPSVIDDKNKLYIPAKSKPKRNNGAKTVPPYHKGGQHQTEWLITGKAKILRDILNQKSDINAYKNIIIGFDNIQKSTIEDNKLTVDKNKLDIIDGTNMIQYKTNLKDHMVNRNLDSIKTTLGQFFQNIKQNSNNLKRQLFNPLHNITGNTKKLIDLYLHSDKSHKFIKIKNIPNDFKEARDHMLKSIKENRKNLHELNKK